MSQTPFLGVFKNSEGQLIDMATGEVVNPKDLKGTRVPFTGVFLDKDGNEHELQDFLGSGSRGGSGIAPPDCYAIFVAAGEGRLTIEWRDPDDVTLEGAVITQWQSTKLIRKIGSFPVNDTDGVLVVTNRVRNQYANGYVDSGLENDTEYFYRLCPISTTGAVNLNDTNTISGISGTRAVFGVSIDLTNSNPETSVTYTDDAVGMTPGSSDWEKMPIFRDIKPCVLKDGVVQYYLNPKNYAQKEDGTAAVITGADGDVMVEFPKCGVRIETIGTTITIKITDSPNNRHFHYYAHTRNEEGDRNNLYLGAYLSKSENTAASDVIFRSVSGQQPTAVIPSAGLEIVRERTQRIGEGYDAISFHSITLLQALWLIRFKHLNSQARLGRGFIDSGRQVTGATNASGMYFGSIAENAVRIKCFGLEDLWGHIPCCFDGIYTVNEDGSYNLYAGFKNFNNYGIGYELRGSLGSVSITGDAFISVPHGNTEMGFVIKKSGGSATTYFSDIGQYNSGAGGIFGGDQTGTLYGYGIFHSRVGAININVGSRIMYL